MHFFLNYDKIKVILSLYRHNCHGVGNINLEIDNNDNYINIKYLDRNIEEKININKNNISSNLKK